MAYYTCEEIKKKLDLTADFRHDEVNAHAKLCKTKTFQDLVEKFFTEMLSEFEGEEFWDTTRIMKLLCTDLDIIKSNAMPHTLRMGRDGVPVCLLMFVLGSQPPPADDSKYYKLRAKALDLKHEFWEVALEVMGDGYAATFSGVTETGKNLFVEAAMEFAKEYIKCTIDDEEGVKKRLNFEIPGLYTRFENPAATDEDRMDFLEAKAIYFGLHGYPLSVVKLADLRAKAVKAAAALAAR